MSEDRALHYLNSWGRCANVANRLHLLISAYELVRADGRLVDWRFDAGRSRDRSRHNPMYCAFAATPFAGNDWFVLRCVHRDGNKLSVGFCPDYGVQESTKASYQPVTQRRRELATVLSLQRVIWGIRRPDIEFPTPDRADRPHAYKGFEYKFQPISDPGVLADFFVKTVLTWAEVVAPLL